MLVSTHETGLTNWGISRLAVMSSTGDVILCGREQQGEPPVFHVYRKSGFWDLKSKMKALCQHELLLILPLIIGHQEMLAVSCPECEKIRLVDLRERTVLYIIFVWDLKSFLS